MSRFNSRTTSATREDIQHEIHNIMSALEELKSSAGKESRRSLDQLRSRAEDLWERSRGQLGSGYQDLSRKTRAATRHASEYAHEHPWATLAFGLGLVAGASLIGWMLYRR
jgi:ElaB/YqjD/DUF883 family membrane-anchored ribosome-binding protein